MARDISTAHQAMVSTWHASLCVAPSDIYIPVGRAPTSFVLFVFFPQAAKKKTFKRKEKRRTLRKSILQKSLDSNVKHQPVYCTS